MSEKECRSCIDYDEGLCDRKGIMVEEDDTCEKHRDCNGCFVAAGDYESVYRDKIRRIQ